LYVRVIWVPGIGTRVSGETRSSATRVRSGSAVAGAFGALVRMSASLASSAARALARSERSPSASDCMRQAMRLTRNSLCRDRVSSPKAPAYRVRSSATVMFFNAAMSFPTFMRPILSALQRALTVADIRDQVRGEAKGLPPDSSASSGAACWPETAAPGASSGRVRRRRSPVARIAAT